MTEQAQLWEPQPGESAKAFQALAGYRDMGARRSLRLVARQLHKSESLMKRWSVAQAWQERVLAWDSAQAQLASEAATEQFQLKAKEIRGRQLRDGQDLQRLSRAGIAQLIERDPETGEPRLRRPLKVAEIVLLHRYGTELESAALPATAPTTDREEAGELGQLLGALPQEDFSTLLAAARKAEQGPPDFTPQEKKAEATHDSKD
jgi:hypothetical protein